MRRRIGRGAVRRARQGAVDRTQPRSHVRPLRARQEPGGPRDVPALPGLRSRPLPPLRSRPPTSCGSAAPERSPVTAWSTRCSSCRPASWMRYLCSCSAQPHDACPCQWSGCCSTSNPPCCSSSACSSSANRRPQPLGRLPPRMGGAHAARSGRDPPGPEDPTPPSDLTRRHSDRTEPVAKIRISCSWQTMSTQSNGPRVRSVAPPAVWKRAGRR